MSRIKVQSALISVYDKAHIKDIANRLSELGVTIYSTGGTETYLREKGIDVIPVETITDFPSVFDGRVKTLHPKIFGGILNRRDKEKDRLETLEYQIPHIDLVIVDLYPFEETVASGSSEEDIIEKIDIGGISLIRAAAKNFKDVLCIPSKEFYPNLHSILNNNGESLEVERKELAKKAFSVSSYYDTAIFNYFLGEEGSRTLTFGKKRTLRYGENPHQKGSFYGDIDNVFEQLHGKSISYNNLLDIDAAVNLIGEFDTKTPAFGIIKHNNACGFAVRDTVKGAYSDALAADPVSAFGGVFVSNNAIDLTVANEINKLFFEILIAPDYQDNAFHVLSSKKNRIILKIKENYLETINKNTLIRSCLNGILEQEKDAIADSESDFTYATDEKPSEQDIKDLIFASKIAKHTKSNTIVLAKNQQLIASGTGQTSRVDALLQAIEKAKKFKFDLKGAVMASDAFFPFPDCVEIAYKEGVKSVIQPGGSKNDTLSIDFCNKNKISMVITGMRHFKH